MLICLLVDVYLLSDVDEDDVDAVELLRLTEDRTEPEAMDVEVET